MKNKLTFTTPIRIYYEDTDAAGVVYYANYLKYFERARTEWLLSMGFDVRELAEQDDLVFVVRSVSVDYHRPARLNELVHATCAVISSGGASIRVRQSVLRDDKVLVSGEVKVAVVSPTTLAPRRIPGHMRDLINSKILS